MKKKPVFKTRSFSAIAENREYLTRIEAAEYLGITAGTMGVWACHKKYKLPYIKVGKRVLYKISDLNKLIELRTLNNH